jgi:hypothetical protein
MALVPVAEVDAPADAEVVEVAEQKSAAVAVEEEVAAAVAAVKHLL